MSAPIKNVPGGRRSKTGAGVSLGVVDEVGLVTAFPPSTSSSLVLNHYFSLLSSAYFDLCLLFRTGVSALGPLFRLRFVVGTITPSVKVQGTF